jgi:hypothetical protein
MRAAIEARAQGGETHTRYTLCGEPAAEARVAQDLSRLSTGIDAELGEEICALLLIGPFARAEGGIVYRDGEPHADLPGYELLAVFRSKPERHAEQLDAMAATWSQLLRTRVAIGAFSSAQLTEVEPTRFWFHAGRGWLITLLGDPAISLAIPRREPAQLREEEAALALCEGFVALALSALEEDPSTDNAVDSLQRAVLACGDSLLLRRGHYADTLAARASALDAIHASAVLRAAYRDAIVFSARPDLWKPESGDLQSWYETTRRALADAIVHAEAERLGSRHTLLGYLRHPRPLFGAAAPAPRSTVQRIVRSLPLRTSRDAWRDRPGERLLRASIALALAPHAPECRACAAEQLGIRDAAPADALLAAAVRALAAQALQISHLAHPFANWRYRPAASSQA